MKSTSVSHCGIVPYLLLAGIMLVAAPMAQAENPVDWDFFVETTGGDASWFSPTNLDTGLPTNDYIYNVTQIDIRTNLLGWSSVLDQLDPADLTGSGSFGTLPQDLVNDTLGDPDLGSVDVQIGIDASGQGFAHLTNPVFGTIPVAGQITGIRIGGDIQVTAIPEPVSLMLLGLPALMLAGRRSRPRRRGL